MQSAEDKVANFYTQTGWETKNEVTEDARRWEDLRKHSREYVSKCRLRVLNHIPEKGENILDMASGPIQYPEYLLYSKAFKKRYCVDLSSSALEDAEKKIGKHGVYLHGSFFDIPLEENFFDCAISLHTIYHIDKDRQEDAVRKLLKVTKPGKPVIVVYNNPKTVAPLLHSLLPFNILTRKANSFLGKKTEPSENESDLYFFAHPLEWWDRFSDIAGIKILPWRSLDSDSQKRLIPDSKIGAKMLALLFNLENRFPNFFAKKFTYPMIILTKRKT